MVEIESDKATAELPAPIDGVVTEIVKKRGERANVGETIAYMEEQGAAKSEAALLHRASGRFDPGTHCAERSQRRARPLKTAAIVPRRHPSKMASCRADDVTWKETSAGSCASPVRRSHARPEPGVRQTARLHSHVAPTARPRRDRRAQPAQGSSHDASTSR